ncbi:putative F420-0 ABC transporter substrate-binding protein [Arthrobacter sp. ZGTC212]|uniref:putative F420-0 ABC transporter substrate-binding protein n=1 Tax=Arthrobacter sp. ZGTC212 TaxID=2058899 RepID=UPI000CE4A421|nr:putative F420-0 ABC transporter substrate-binding protein [Arthrobacter sp. ZGTC212]
MNRTRVSALSLLLAAALAGTVGCSTAAAPAAQPDAGPSAPPSSSYPVSVSNCGTEVTLTAAPERIVAIKSTSLETVLALGLGSKVVGAAFLDGPVPESLADEADSLPSLSDAAPSQEVVLEREPDFIYAGWESNLSADAAGERGVLASLGINTYVSPAACREEGLPGKLTFESVFEDITEAGALLGAPEAAAALVAEQREILAGVSPAGDGMTAFWFSSGRDTPYAGAGLGAPQMMMEQLGLENIAADVQESWASLSWETVVDANPDVIVLVDADRNTAESKKELLAANPATAGMDAVINERYLVLPFAAGEAGVRNADAVADLAGQLTRLP